MQLTAGVLVCAGMAWLPRLVAELAGSAQGDVDPDAPFEDYGLDSLMLISLAQVRTPSINSILYAIYIDKYINTYMRVSITCI